ncbi:hypothetical protein [Nostoc sp.]|uniref:hypothetical protein n=1 Tax=Nostoc sp. TaxID=1180 RepID=UPI003FA5E530
MTKGEVVLLGSDNSKSKGKCYGKGSKKLTNQRITKIIEPGKISLSSPSFLSFYFRKKSSLGIFQYIDKIESVVTWEDYAKNLLAII